MRVKNRATAITGRLFLSLLTTLAVLLTLSFTISPQTVYAAPGDIGNTDGWWWQQVGEDWLEILTYQNPVGNLTLPDTLDGKTVIYIRDDAFKDCTSLTGISLPDTLRIIGSSAFENTGLTGITLPDSLTSLGSRAFADCASLSTATLSTNVFFTTLMSETFTGTSLSGGITIPSNINTIENGVFSYSGLTSITIPNTVTSIGPGAFMGCSELQSIVLPPDSGLIAIQNRTFSGCTKLSSIYIPNSVTTFGVFVFENCSALSSIRLPESSSFTAIPQEMFAGLGSLTTITFPDNIATIGNGAFTGSGLAGNIELGAGVQTIGPYAFAGTDITSFTVKSGNTRFVAHDGVVYDSTGAQLILLPPGYTGVFTVPSGVTEIFEYACISCTGLTGVNLPESLRYIDFAAFAQSGLTSVTIPAGVNTIYMVAFDGTPMTRAIFLGDSTVINGLAFPPTLSDDGVYGHAGSTAEAFAAAAGYPFNLLLELSPSPASLHIYTGGRITITPNVPEGTWDFDGSLLSRSGNQFTGLAAGTVRVTYTAGWQSEYVDVVVLDSGLPSTGQDGTWIWALSAAALVLLTAAMLIKRKRISTE